MDQRISVTTLIVEDVAATRRFFEEGLGWHVNSSPAPNVVFFQMTGGVFALYGRAALAEEIGQPVTASPLGAITLAWNGHSEAEVDKTFLAALAAGARPVKEPQKAFWGGYSSYVEIPGGHLMEIAYNPFWSMDADGSVLLQPVQ